MLDSLLENGDNSLTLFDSMALLKRFVDQTGIREDLATLDLPPLGRLQLRLRCGACHRRHLDRAGRHIRCD
jgi:hypothetical protein